MTHEEAKKAWFAKVPVVSGGIKYTKIKALIYELNDKNEIIVCAELLDKCKNSVTITKIDNVEVEKKYDNRAIADSGGNIQDI